MTPTRVSAAVWLALSLVVAGGCHPITKVGDPLTTQLAGNDAKTQLAFWHALAEHKITSNDEAFHGLLLFLDDEDSTSNYTDRVEQLKVRGVLAADFDRPAEEAINRGTLAVAIVAALNIKGGLTLDLFPHSPRYATRELQYIGIYPRSSPHQTFSGSEFLGIIGRVEDYERVLSGHTSMIDEEAVDEFEDLEPEQMKEQIEEQ